VKLDREAAFDPAKFVELLGRKILDADRVSIERIVAATVENSTNNAIEWLVAEAVVCASGDNKQCAEFSAEAKFTKGRADVKFSKLMFLSDLNNAEGS